MKADLVESVRIRVRYDFPNEHGETRRERNENFDQSSPDYNVPHIVRHIWDRYFEISSSIRRVKDGACSPIPPSEFLAWSRLTRTVISIWEYEVLRAMDDAYRSEVDQELKDYQERQKDAMKTETQAARRTRR